MLSRRRFFEACAAVVASVEAQAQTATKTYKLGMLGNTRSSAWDALVKRLRELGHVEGQNLAIEWRFSAGKQDRFPQLAAELIAANVDLIVTSSTPSTLAAQRATRTIPIVMGGGVGDPVGSGFVASLARPSGNITGFTNILVELFGKQLGLIKELVPGARRVGVLWSANPGEPLGPAEEQVAQALGLGLQPVLARQVDELGPSLNDMLRQRPDALLVYGNGVNGAGWKTIVEFCRDQRIPAMYYQRFFVERGGLIYHGPDLDDLFRGAAGYVDRILQGTHPSELPVQQANKFNLVINRKAAETLRLQVPQVLLLRADEVIE